MRKTAANLARTLSRFGMLALLALAVVSGQAAAQTNAGQQPTPPPQPRAIIIPNDIYHGPPAPPERQIAPPRSSQEIAPPMPRPEPLPQMLPRVGN
jgi:hypothetical protein